MIDIDPVIPDNVSGCEVGLESIDFLLDDFSVYGALYLRRDFVGFKGAADIPSFNQRQVASSHHSLLNKLHNDLRLSVIHWLVK